MSITFSAKQTRLIRLCVDKLKPGFHIIIVSAVRVPQADPQTESQHRLGDNSTSYGNTLFRLLGQSETHGCGAGRVELSSTLPAFTGRPRQRKNLMAGSTRLQ